MIHNLKVTGSSPGRGIKSRAQNPSPPPKKIESRKLCKRNLEGKAKGNGLDHAKMNEGQHHSHANEGKVLSLENHFPPSLSFIFA